MATLPRCLRRGWKLLRCGDAETGPGEVRHVPVVKRRAEARIGVAGGWGCLKGEGHRGAAGVPADGAVDLQCPADHGLEWRDGRDGRQVDGRIELQPGPPRADSSVAGLAPSDSTAGGTKVGQVIEDENDKAWSMWPEARSERVTVPARTDIPDPVAAGFPSTSALPGPDRRLTSPHDDAQAPVRLRCAYQNS